VGKIGEINPTIADLYGRAIKTALEPEDRVKFLGGPERPDPPLGVLKSQAEDRFGPFPSPDEARQALADDIAKWGEDADQNATITEDNGVLTATSLDGTHIAIRDTNEVLAEDGTVMASGPEDSNQTTALVPDHENEGGEEDDHASLHRAAQREANTTGKPSINIAKPGDDSPIHPEFREKLHRHESEGKPNQGYEAKNGDALGRYQMTPPALKDAGYMDAKGKWTGKDGIKSEQDFLKNPEIQEKALTEFMAKVEGYVRTSGLNSREGKEIDGIRNKFEVTENGIMAAAHRRGASATDAYFQHQEKNGWKSQFDKIDPAIARQADPKHDGQEAKQVFMSIETRLRQFADVPYRR